MRAEFKIQELNNSVVNGKEKTFISVRITIPYFIQFQMLWEIICKDSRAFYYQAKHPGDSKTSQRCTETHRRSSVPHSNTASRSPRAKTQGFFSTANVLLPGHGSDTDRGTSAVPDTH